MKKKIAMLLIIIGLSLSLASCIIHPTSLDNGSWYFESVTINDIPYYPGEYTEEFKEEYIYDYCLFKFFADNTIVVSKYYNGEVITSGSYLAKDEQIFISLDNGDSFTGTCNRFMFDGVWYVFELINEDFTLNLNDSRRCDYSRSLDNYYVRYDSNNLNELSSFFYSEEKNEEIQTAYENIYDNRISEDFIEFYDNVKDLKTNILVPSLYKEGSYSIKVHSSNQYNKPWITYVCYDSSGFKFNLSLMYITTDLAVLDKELATLLKINDYVKRIFDNKYYIYFIYNIPSSNNQVLSRISHANNGEITDVLLKSIDFYQLER